MRLSEDVERRLRVLVEKFQPLFREAKGDPAQVEKVLIEHRNRVHIIMQVVFDDQDGGETSGSLTHFVRPAPRLCSSTLRLRRTATSG